MKKKKRLKKGTQKKKAVPSLKKIIRRNLPPSPGVDNLLTIKSGKELLENLTTRHEIMKRDYTDVEFFWNKLISDSSFNGTIEYPKLSKLVAGWELKEGIKSLEDYKKKLKWLKTLIDHFDSDYNYELRIHEVVEIFS